MSRFENKLCPVCRKPLTADSDVVVCPICGTPHHRECYLINNRCGVEEYHASGFEWHGALPWEQPQAETDPEQEAAQDVFVGQEKNTDPHHAEYPSGTPDSQQGGIPQGMPMDLEEYLEQLHAQTMDETRGEDGVSSKELTCFVGRSVMHYSQAFSIFRAPVPPGMKKRRTSFNLCAGLFAPVHQFYRKMDGVGFILLVLEIAYYIPNLMSMMGMAGTGLLRGVQTATSIVSFAVMVLMCIFGDYLYYRFAVRRIKQIRMEFDDGRKEGYYEALTERGTPSWLRAIIAILAVYFVEVCLIVYFTQIAPNMA